MQSAMLTHNRRHRKLRKFPNPLSSDHIVYKIPYRRALAWPGLGRVRARAKVFYIKRTVLPISSPIAFPLPNAQGPNHATLYFKYIHLTK